MTDTSKKQWSLWSVRAGAIALGIFLMFSFGLMRGHLVAADDSTSTPPTTDQQTTSDPTTNAPTSTDTNTTPPANTDAAQNNAPQNVTSTADNTATATTTVNTNSNTGGNAATSTQATSTSNDAPTSTIDTNTNLSTSTDATSTTPTSTDPGNIDLLNSTSSPDTSTSTGNSTSTNDALLLNSTSTDATSTDGTSTSTDLTADDTAGGGGGGNAGADISTGDAVSVVNLSNVVNTNIVDSQGFLAFLNLFQPFFGNLDFSTISFAPSVSECSSCTAGSLTSNSTNTASIVNNVSVTAVTGGNTASSNGGASTIQTGNAYAAANIVNIANTNIIGSNYLMLVLNNFNQMNGDLILPGADFFSNLLGGNGGSSGGGNLTVNNDNTANVSNNADTNADTGGNTATGSGTSTVATGDAVAASNALTVANSNLTANGQVIILVRVFGNWNGNVFSTPPGLLWQQTPNGIMLTGSGVNDALCDCNGSTTATNANTADITNNVHVYALTGENKIQGGSGGSITTGNAGAVANTVNIVNTNVVGHNILLALVNIFGDWQGNLAFGQPDLWVGATADAPSTLVPGSVITYHVTVKNNGTADATNVQVQTSDDQDGIAFVTNTGGGTKNGTSSVIWNIPTLARGASQTFTYTERLFDPLPFYGDGELTEGIQATEHEDDANPTDNVEQISFGVRAPSMNMPWQSSVLWLREFNNATATIAPGNFVHFRLIVGNKGNGPANDVHVHETLYDPLGTPVSTSTWELGTLEPGDVYMVSFDAGFAPNLKTGWFTSYSSIDGMDVSGRLHPNDLFTSSSSVYVVNPDDYAPKPPPLIVFVPPPATSTPRAGDNNTNIKIDTLPKNTFPDEVHASSKKKTAQSPDIAELSCPASSNGSFYGESATTTERKANLTASLSDIFTHENSTSNFGGGFPDFITSTLLAFGAVFMKFH